MSDTEVPAATLHDGDPTEAAKRARQLEAQLAELQRIAHIGSWEWSIPENRVIPTLKSEPSRGS
jgi:hypothetical protein